MGQAGRLGCGRGAACRGFGCRLALASHTHALHGPWALHNTNHPQPCPALRSPCLQPRSHTIIEAHPDVFKYACSQGWDRKPGVRLVHGRWQDVIDQARAGLACLFRAVPEFCLRSSAALPTGKPSAPDVACCAAHA